MTTVCWPFLGHVGGQHAKSQSIRALSVCISSSMCLACTSLRNEGHTCRIANQKPKISSCIIGIACRTYKVTLSPSWQKLGMRKCEYFHIQACYLLRCYGRIAWWKAGFHLVCLGTPPSGCQAVFGIVLEPQCPLDRRGSSIASLPL